MKLENEKVVFSDGLEKTFKYLVLKINEINIRYTTPLSPERG